MPARPIVAVFRSPLFNDSETFVQSHISQLERYEPLLVGLHDRGNIPADLRRRLVTPAHALQTARIKLLGQSASLAEAVARHQPALIHAHFGTDGLLALPLARRLEIPLVTTLHGYEVNRSRATLLSSGRLSWMRYGLFQRRLMAQGDLFLAVSDALRRRAIAAGYPETRTVVHYNGIDVRRFPSATLQRERGLIVHVARLVEKKGTRVLIRAFADARRTQPDARLVIIGDGPLAGELRRDAAACGVGQSVAFTGVLGPAEVSDWMRRAWLLAVPSVTARDGDAEGLPTVILEAAASGLPVIGSNHGGIPEAVIDGDTGAVVEEGNVSALGAALTRLLQSSTDRHAAMAAAARRLFETRFDARRLMATLEAHYDRVVQNAGSRCA
jgi:glycosyltransferase involved in cell wall biosynthesis